MGLKLAIEKAKNDPKYFSETLLKLVYKGRVFDWEYNLPQNFVLEARLRQEKAKRPVRLVILKARREGVSTQIQGWLFQKLTTRPYRLGMVISHEQDSADEIADISRRFWEFLPPDKRPSIPGSKLPHTKTFVFDKLSSKLKIETANDVNAGRSIAIDYIHASEVAFWRNAETLMLGLLQCVDDKDSDTMVIVESTANGIGGYFYDLVQKAITGENDYELVFLPWFIDSRYQMDPPPDFKATPEEEKIRVQYQWQDRKIVLSDAQLYWRRHIIKNKCNGDEIKFRQEYPGTVSEAFVYSGRTRFNQESLSDIERKARPPVFRGFIHQENKQGGGKSHKLEPNDRGYLTIYEKPDHKAKYVIFADVAEGIEINGRDTDFSSIDVLRCDTLEQVAHWHGRIGPEFLDDEILKLAWYYNEAFVGIEKNSIGYGVVASVKDQYNRVYIREIQDKQGKTITKEYGWRTTGSKGGTKGLMVKDLAQAIFDQEIKINNHGTIEECRRFTSHADGSLAAPQGCHDDRVISIAGALQMYFHAYHKPVDDGDDYDDDDFYDDEE